MFGPTAKYRRLTHDSAGVPLYWYGNPDHYPMRGSPQPLLTPDEIRSTELVFHARYKLFTLPADTKEYLEVKDQQANGVVMVTDEMKFPDPQSPTQLVVHLWWIVPEAVQGERQPPPPRTPPSRPPFLPPPWS